MVLARVGVTFAGVVKALGVLMTMLLLAEAIGGIFVTSGSPSESYRFSFSSLKEEIVS